MWKTIGEKRTIIANCEPEAEVLEYLKDMKEAVNHAMLVAYWSFARHNFGAIPSPITLRKMIRDWFYVRFSYARHHINPVCRTAVALLKSYRKTHHGKLRIPKLTKLAMKIDKELFKLVGGRIRVTLQPNRYAWLPVNTKNKHHANYSRGRPSELLVTDKKVYLTFVIQEREKPVGARLLASDLNFGSLDMTKASLEPALTLTGVETMPLRSVVQIQNGYSRRREGLQRRIRNPRKRDRKLRETRGKQRNRIKDALHKLSSKLVSENPETSFVFENLKGIRKRGKGRNRDFRAYLNKWPYRMYQSFVEYKSRNATLYPNPRGTSSECPVCGGKLEHPAWAISRCRTCGVDYDRNRLASLAILCRGLRLCGQPFAVSADASWQHMRHEYLQTREMPDAVGAGWTNDAANAPNKDLDRNVSACGNGR